MVRMKKALQHLPTHDPYSQMGYVLLRDPPLIMIREVASDFDEIVYRGENFHQHQYQRIKTLDTNDLVKTQNQISLLCSRILKRKMGLECQ